MIRDEDLPPGVTIIRDSDLQNVREVRRLDLSIRALSKQLGVPDDILRGYRKIKLIHEMRRGEKDAGVGFSTEELAAFIVLSHCQIKHGLPLGGSHELVREICRRLCNVFSPSRVFFCLRTQGTVRDGCLVNGEQASVRVPDGETIDIFDLTQLLATIEETIDVEPLSLPRADSCVVPIGDRRRIDQP